MAKHIYAGPKQRWFENLPISPFALIVVLVAVLIIVGAAVFSGISSDSQAPEEIVLSEQEVADTASPPREQLALELSPSSLDAASGTEVINLFSAVDGSSGVLNAETAAPIDAAIAAFSEQGYEASFVVIDLSTGKGLGYNADEAFFAASTVKAPYVSYVSQTLIETGQASVTDYIVKNIVVDGTGIMASDNEVGYELFEVMADTIIYSDNTGYALLRESYDGPAWAEWVSASGVTTSATEGEWYPYYSARDLAKFWISINEYLVSETYMSLRLKDLFASTGTSFLREALAPTATVYAKAGYEVDTETFDMGSLSDAGIVAGPSGDYLIAVMSDVDYDDGWLTDNKGLIVNLITALDAAHAGVLAD